MEDDENNAPDPLSGERAQESMSSLIAHMQGRKNLPHGDRATLLSAGFRKGAHRGVNSTLTLQRPQMRRHLHTALLVGSRSCP